MAPVRLSCDMGDAIRVTSTYVDPFNSDTPIDPEDVMFSVRSPCGAVTTYVYGTDTEVVRTDTGVYHVDITIDAAGVWHVRGWSTGDGQAAEEAELVAKQHYAVA